MIVGYVVNQREIEKATKPEQQKVRSMKTFSYGRFRINIWG